MKRSNIPLAIVTIALVASPALAGGRFDGRIARNVQTNGNSAVSSINNAQKIVSKQLSQSTSWNWKKGADLLNGQGIQTLTGPTWARPHDANSGNGLNPTGGKKWFGQSQIPGSKPNTTTTVTNTVSNKWYQGYLDFGNKAEPTPFAAQTHHGTKSILADSQTVTSDQPLVKTANPPGGGGREGNPGYVPNVDVRDHRGANNPNKGGGVTVMPAPGSNDVVGVGDSPIDDAIHYFADPFPHGSLSQEGQTRDHRTTPPPPPPPAGGRGGR